MKKGVKNPKVERTRNAGTMTEAAYFGKIRSLLRRAFRDWKPMVNALNKTRRASQNTARPRLKWEYQCNECKLWFAREDVQMDHKIPCGTLSKLSDVPSFLYRLTAEDEDAFQTLCIGCHLEKSKEENYARRYPDN